MKLDLNLKPGQSIDLLKELHILTRDGKINQDSRRKLKQVYHLHQFIEPHLKKLINAGDKVSVVDHGSGKNYLGFIINDLFLKNHDNTHIYGIETREDLVTKSQELAKKMNVTNMSFLNLSVEESTKSNQLPETVSMVTALHACNTATDDAIQFGLEKKAKYIVIVPCCQAEVAACLKKNKSKQMKNDLVEIWRHAIHGREFGSHITNVLRCLELEANGYQVTVTELIGWEHSMKNELIIAEYKDLPRAHPKRRIESILKELGLEELGFRFGL